MHKRIEIDGTKYKAFINPIQGDVREVSQYYPARHVDNGYGFLIQRDAYWKPLKYKSPRFNKVANSI